MQDLEQLPDGYIYLISFTKIQSTDYTFLRHLPKRQRAGVVFPGRLDEKKSIMVCFEKRFQGQKADILSTRLLASVTQ